jgi:hypothetical protein
MANPKNEPVVTYAHPELQFQNWHVSNMRRRQSYTQADLRRRGLSILGLLLLMSAAKGLPDELATRRPADSSLKKLQRIEYWWAALTPFAA